MEKEKLVNRSTVYTVNIAGNKVDALRLKEDLQTVVRVYEDGKIGIAGAIGQADEAALEEEAAGQLAQEIPYPEMLEEGKTRVEDRSKPVVPPEEFLKTTRALVSRLARQYPDFIFSNKIWLENSQKSYENSKGTSYLQKLSQLILSFSIKARASANIMDLFYSAFTDSYDEDKVVADVGALLNVYSNRVPLPEEELPVILHYSFAAPALADIIAEKYMSGASIFSGKLGQKIFDERVNLLVDRSSANKECQSFFDAEGTTLPGDKFYFIKDGVLQSLCTYKRSAASFDMPLSGCAGAEFDAVPSFGFDAVTFAVTADSLKDIIKGKAIYVAVSSGGDMTPDGNVGLPVLLAYLYEDGKLTATLPEFSISGNIFDIFGKDFIGIARNDVFTVSDECVVAARFKINK